MSVRILDTADVQRSVSMRDVIKAVRQALLNARTGDFDQPQRASFGEGRALVMPIYHRPTGTTAVKSLNINPDRQPRIVGSISWTDPTSEDVLVVDAEAVTTLRTGAVVALATDLLAAADARRLFVFGAGAQAADQVHGVAAVRDLGRVTLCSPTPRRGEALAARLGQGLADVPVGWLPTESDAAWAELLAADIVCCATPATQPLFGPARLAPQAHVNAIGSFHPALTELSPALLAEASVIAVDDSAGCLAEAGELINAIEEGAITAESVTSLADLLNDPPHRQGRTVFKSVGAATLDWAAMAAVTRVWAEKG